MFLRLALPCRTTWWHFVVHLNLLRGRGSTPTTDFDAPLARMRHTAFNKSGARTG